MVIDSQSRIISSQTWEKPVTKDQQLASRDWPKKRWHFQRVSHSRILHQFLFARTRIEWTLWRFWLLAQQTRHMPTDALNLTSISRSNIQTLRCSLIWRQLGDIQSDSTQIYTMMVKCVSPCWIPGKDVPRRSGTPWLRACCKFWSQFKAWFWFLTLTSMSLVSKGGLERHKVLKVRRFTIRIYIQPLFNGPC